MNRALTDTVCPQAYTFAWIDSYSKTNMDRQYICLNLLPSGVYTNTDAIIGNQLECTIPDAHIVAGGYRILAEQLDCCNILVHASWAGITPMNNVERKQILEETNVCYAVGSINSLDVPARLEVDREAKALYFRLREREIAETVEYPEVEEIFLDLDDQGQILGIEILDPGRIDIKSVLAELAKRYNIVDLSPLLSKSLMELVA